MRVKSSRICSVESRQDYTMFPINSVLSGQVLRCNVRLSIQQDQTHLVHGTLAVCAVNNFYFRCFLHWLYFITLFSSSFFLPNSTISICSLQAYQTKCLPNSRQHISQLSPTTWMAAALPKATYVHMDYYEMSEFIVKKRAPNWQLCNQSSFTTHSSQSQYPRGTLNGRIARILMNCWPLQNPLHNIPHFRLLLYNSMDIEH